MPGKTVRLTGCLLILLLMVGCSSEPYLKNPTPLGAPGTQVPPIESEYRIHVGDKLDVRLFYNPELNHEVVVRPDGRISLELVHEVMAAGLTPAELTETLAQAYKPHVQQPEVTVIVSSFTGHKVYIAGEVGAAGVRELAGPTTVYQAIASAGGFKDTARTKEVVVIRRDADHKPFAVSLKLKDVLDGTDMSQDVYLQPYDIVYVPKSTIANVNLWMEQYLSKAALVVPSQFFNYWLTIQTLRGSGN
jgi:protein involved in polysaccharide export with SLBB domain